MGILLRLYYKMLYKCYLYKKVYTYKFILKFLRPKHCMKSYTGSRVAKYRQIVFITVVRKIEVEKLIFLLQIVAYFIVILSL